MWGFVLTIDFSSKPSNGGDHPRVGQQHKYTDDFGEALVDVRSPRVVVFAVDAM